MLVVPAAAAEVVVVVFIVAVVVVLGVEIGVYVMVDGDGGGGGGDGGAVAVQTCPAAFGPAVRAVWVLPCPLTSSVDGLLHSDKLPFTFCPLSPRRSSVSVFVFPSPSGGDAAVTLQSGSTVVGHGS